MPEMEDGNDYDVGAWTKDGHNWWWRSITKEQAEYIYKTLRAGNTYEETHDPPNRQCIQEYIDGTHIYQVKIYHRPKEKNE